MTNPGGDDLDYTVALAVSNPARAGSVNRARRDGAAHLLTLAASGIACDHPSAGDLTVATDSPGVSYQECWFRGMWFDDLTIYWHDFTAPGGFENRSYPEPGEAGHGFVRGDTGVLAATLGVPAGETRTARFVLTWSYPNCVNYWHPVGVEQEQRDEPPPALDHAEWRNHYATRFPDSAASASYCLREWERLRDHTLAFRDALYASSVPPVVLDAAAATLSVLKSPTVLRLEDGTFYGFEGVRVEQGCCEGSCTHVWNYACALPFLFPDLERSMRDADFRYNAAADGGMTFRLQLPLGRERLGFRPCADGQFGGVIKAYRDWKISGDSAWLRGHWETIKRNISFAWADSNPDRWDADRDGVLEGRQHHTLDMELFGPNSWLTGFYLAALAAGAEMAEHLGEADTAAEYRALFARGKEWVDANLFNGEYYQQRIDLTDRSTLQAYEGGDAAERYRGGRSQVWNYWDDEHGQIKYQVAEGCAIDQVLAQWHANICGLGEVFDRGQTRSALAAIYRHNFKRSFREHFNPARLYALDDEAGTIICSYPRALPVVPITYAQETMHGFEYQAAGHMIQEGMLAEGVELVRAVRDRYDGSRRNPWNEIECGSNYARLHGRLRAAAGLFRVRVRRRPRPRRLQSEGGRHAVHGLLEPGLRLGNLHAGRGGDQAPGRGGRASAVQLRERPDGPRHGDRRAGERGGNRLHTGGRHARLRRSGPRHRRRAADHLAGRGALMVTDGALRWSIGHPGDDAAAAGIELGPRASTSARTATRGGIRLPAPGIRARRRSTSHQVGQVRPNGTAFGMEPACGAFPGQEPVTGFQGSRLGQQQEPQPGHADRRAAVGGVHDRWRRHRLPHRRGRLRGRHLPSTCTCTMPRGGSGCAPRPANATWSWCGAAGTWPSSAAGRPICRSWTTRPWSRGAGTPRRATRRMNGASSSWTTSAQTDGAPDPRRVDEAGDRARNFDFETVLPERFTSCRVPRMRAVPAGSSRSARPRARRGGGLPLLRRRGRTARL